MLFLFESGNYSFANLFIATNPTFYLGIIVLNKKEEQALNLRYKKILRSMVFGNFTAAVQSSVQDNGSDEADHEHNVLPFCG